MKKSIKAYDRRHSGDNAHDVILCVDSLHSHQMIGKIKSIETPILPQQSDHRAPRPVQPLSVHLSVICQFQLSPTAKIPFSPVKVGKCLLDRRFVRLGGNAVDELNGRPKSVELLTFVNPDHSVSWHRAFNTSSIRLRARQICAKDSFRKGVKQYHSALMSVK